MPLTGVSARRIAEVVHLVNTEDKSGAVVQWETISADGTSVELDLSTMKPAIKIRAARTFLEAVLEAVLGDDRRSWDADVGALRVFVG